MIWRLLLRRANSVVAVLLVAFGAAAMRWSSAIGDKGAAATLAGALFGAAALFAGSEINEWSREAADREESEKTQRRVRSALAPEFVCVCINLIGFSSGLATYSKFFSTEWKKAQKKGNQKSFDPGSFELTNFIPPPAPWFEQLHVNALCLPEHELEALSNFYGHLQITRLTIQEMAAMLKTTRADLYQHFKSFDFVVRRMRCNLEDALTVAKLSWPSRKAESFEGKEMLISEQLRSTIEKLKDTELHEID
jgi:hypothetical protein